MFRFGDNFNNNRIPYQIGPQFMIAQVDRYGYGGLERVSKSWEQRGEKQKERKQNNLNLQCDELKENWVI